MTERKVILQFINFIFGIYQLHYNCVGNSYIFLSTVELTSTMIAKVLFINLFLLNIITSRKLRTPGVDALNFKTEKLNECGRCKVLTDSFSHWLEKTSRGKYEGGDTAWEEAKLKPYARSEIRFVEVQEGLCSELSKYQHECYTLADEAEQMLEKWWFHEDPNTVDLHTWLCIETLKHCCPINHFGESCAPCPLDKDRRVCSGHGRCDGNGTRSGNGICVCNRGYSGNYCEECSKNFYAYGDSCERCDPGCEDCSSAGPAACKSCKTGWKLDSGVCTDIDECLSSSICKSDQYCFNKEGTYRCIKCDDSCKSCTGAGPSNCTSCEPTYYLWSGKCITESLKSDILKSAVIRMIIYIGLLVIPGVIYQAQRHIALLVFIIFGIYVYYTERSLEHDSTFNVYFKNFGGIEGAWF